MALKRAKCDPNGSKIAIFSEKLQKFLNNYPWPPAAGGRSPGPRL